MSACDVYDSGLWRIGSPPNYGDATLVELDSGDAPAPDSGTSSSDASAADSGQDASTTKDGGNVGTDAGADAGADASTDAGADAASDAGTDAAADAGSDAGTDAGADAGMDAGTDASMDAATDAGDAAMDASADAEAGVDATTDSCPGDPSKTDPGVCGCGIPENCTGLISALTHRYRFDGSGTTLTDSKGTAHGTSGTSLTGAGSLTLASGNYATLPSGLLSAYTGTTVEFWVTWQGGGQRQRALSFGSATPTKPTGTCTGTADYFRGSWYLFCAKDGSMTWSKARTRCEGVDGALVGIESVEEDQYLYSHPSFTGSVWIGANDQQTEGQWYFATSDGLQGGLHFWSGDENGSPVAGAYTNWRSDQANPDDSSSTTDCAFISKTISGWWAYGCEFDGAFVCEWHGHQGTSINRGVSFTPSDSTDLPALTYQAGTSSVVAKGSSAFPTSTLTHVALVLDPSSNTIALYINGALAGSVAGSDALANLRDADNWLGRSHISTDPGFGGSLSEMRIYNRALTAQELSTSRTAGPDPAFLP